MDSVHTVLVPIHPNGKRGYNRLVREILPLYLRKLNTRVSDRNNNIHSDLMIKVKKRRNDQTKIPVPDTE